MVICYCVSEEAPMNRVKIIKRVSRKVSIPRAKVKPSKKAYKRQKAKSIKD
jgi:hypothetical protein